MNIGKLEFTKAELDLFLWRRKNCSKMNEMILAVAFLMPEKYFKATTGFALNA